MAYTNIAVCYIFSLGVGLFVVGVIGFYISVVIRPTEYIFFF